MKQERLTTRQDWDEYLNKVELPAEIKKEGKNLFLNEILNVFDRYLSRNEKLSILEIGGAPGQYLVYMARNFGYKIHALDYSAYGCERTKKNFELLGLDGAVYQRDLFSDLSDLPRFDIVYSLGFMEHFEDLEKVIEKHLELLKPGGILLIGTPNFLGVNRMMFKRLAPEILAKHNLASMDVNNWLKFENKFRLRPVFKGYVGGFEPGIYWFENKTFINKVMYYFIMRFKLVITDVFKFLRKYNSRYWSGYAIGIYEKAAGE